MATEEGLSMLGLCLLLVVGVLLSDLASGEQQILDSHETETGVLRRFANESAISQILALAEQHNLDIWHANQSLVDIYSPPDAPFLPPELASIHHELIPLHRLAEKSRLITTDTDWNLSSLQNSTFHDVYHPLEEVQSFLTQLVAAFPDSARLSNFGHSAEGRAMIALTISSGGYVHKKKGDVNERKKRKKTRPPLREGEKLGFVIIGAQHAREWIATSTSLYLAHALLTNASEPNSLGRLLDHFDFYFVPVPNPDGYEYTWKTDRYWYKNRQILGPYTKCIGLDMNRNWGHKWKSTAVGTTSYNDSNFATPLEPTDPCSHWYPGTRPFESYEVNNMANWVRSLPNLAGFIDLRNYGQMLSSPFSFSCKRIPKDAEDQIEAATGASQALKSAHGTDFKVGNLCSTLYAAPGNVLDWMYVREGIKYSYVAHLRDTGTYGFTLPEKWIRPTGEETSRLLDYLARFIARQTNRHF